MPKINTYTDNATIEDNDKVLTYDEGAAATKLTKFGTVKNWMLSTLAGAASRDAADSDQILTVRGSVVGRSSRDTLAKNILESYAGSSIGGASQSVKAALDSMAADVTELKAKADAAEDAAEWSAIADAVTTGRPYSIGDTILEPWTDIAAGRSYDNPWRVNHYEEMETESGRLVNGVWLQNSYAHPFGVQFSHQRAFLACPDGLSAGVYNIKLGATWGSKDAVKDTVWQFTLTKAVEKGGCLAGFYGMPDNAASTWKVYNYKADRKTLVETVSVTSGSGGTSLGTLALNTRSGNLNSMQETAYGWNRWKTSAIRQYLNSDAGIGEWWTPQDQWDIAPDQLATKPGFLSGLPKGMVDAMVPVKLTTYTNTVQDGGTADITYDKVMLMSLQQMYFTPQIQGEGAVHDYWKQVNGTSTPYATGTTNIYPELIHYAVENHASAQGARIFRSASRSHAYGTWYLGSAGYVHNSGSSSAYRPVPLVFIGR